MTEDASTLAAPLRLGFASKRQNRRPGARRNRRFGRFRR